MVPFSLLRELFCTPNLECSIREMRRGTLEREKAPMKRHSWLVGLACLLLATACASQQGPSGPTGTFNSPLQPVSARTEAILFMSDSSGKGLPYLMAPDGTDVRELKLNGLPANALLDRPVWSTALEEFVFRVDVGSDSEIYRANRDGTGVTSLTNTPEQVEADPAVSPDGKYIAFVAQEDDLDIFVMRSDGSDRQNLTHHPARDVGPVWSPDSQTILFVSNRGGTPNIWMIHPDGSGLTNLSKGSGQDSSPAWSPDGRRIAFQSDRGGSNDIYAMDADGKNVKQLTNDPGMDVEPAWAPDGSLIAFRSDRDGGWDIYTIRPDGSSPANLTRSPSVEETALSWEPDSKHILYAARPASKYQVFAAATDGATPVALTTGQANDYAPVWVQFVTK